MIFAKTRNCFSIGLVLCVTAITRQAQRNFESPDSASDELVRIAELYGPDISYGTTIDRYIYVIENAIRPMDDLALRVACYGLANHYFRTNCSDSGYECPHPGDELWGEWPASMNSWIDDLKAQYPILRRCPEKSIHRDDRLPWRRVSPVPSADVLAQKITGWVELKVDIDAQGNVKNVTLVDGSSSLLEASAIDAARRFKYSPKVDENSIPIAERGVKLTVSTDYSILAKYSGCSPK